MSQLGLTPPPPQIIKTLFNFRQHRATLKKEDSENHTTLSNYVWKQKNMGKEPKISWRYIEKNVPDFNPVTQICRLCTREKFQIVLNPEVASLNQRTEMFSACKHKEFYIIGDPPD